MGPILTDQKQPQLSKRVAYRFRCNKEPVSYRTAYDEGEGLLTNISTDGCAVEWATNPPELDERILLSIELENENNTVEVQARVVRSEESDFAVQFTLIEPDSKTLIRKYFAGKLRGN